MDTLLFLFILSVILNVFMFFIAYYFKTDKLTDISYALTFVLLSILGLINSNKSLSSIILTLMLCIWAFRLGMYLLKRIRKIGKDKRFDDKRDKFWSFLGFWLLQGISVWIVMLPSNLFYSIDSSKVSFLTIIGIGIWAIGLIIEAIADYQKFQFINNIQNKGKWIETGLWKYSRHPNYFGEIVLWCGIYVFTLSGLTASQSLIGLIGPLYIATLIIFVSGIPLLEKSADKKWGEDKNYQTYKKQTSILALLPKIK